MGPLNYLSAFVGPKDNHRIVAAKAEGVRDCGSDLMLLLLVRNGVHICHLIDQVILHRRQLSQTSLMSWAGLCISSESLHLQPSSYVMQHSPPAVRRSGQAREVACCALHEA